MIILGAFDKRKALFKRIGAGSSTDIQTVAANIDMLFLEISCNAEFIESLSYKNCCENAQATASLAEKNAQGRQLAKMIKEVKSLKQERGG